LTAFRVAIETRTWPHPHPKPSSDWPTAWLLKPGNPAWKPHATERQQLPEHTARHGTQQPLSRVMIQTSQLHALFGELSLTSTILRFSYTSPQWRC